MPCWNTKCGNYRLEQAATAIPASAVAARLDTRGMKSTAAEALTTPLSSLEPFVRIHGPAVDSRLDVAERIYSDSLEELAGRSSGEGAELFVRF